MPSIPPRRSGRGRRPAGGTGPAAGRSPPPADPPPPPRTGPASAIRIVPHRSRAAPPQRLAHPFAQERRRQQPLRRRPRRPVAGHVGREVVVQAVQPVLAAGAFAQLGRHVDAAVQERPLLGPLAVAAAQAGRRPLRQEPRQPAGQEIQQLHAPAPARSRHGTPARGRRDRGGKRGFAAGFSGESPAAASARPRRRRSRAASAGRRRFGRSAPRRSGRRARPAGIPRRPAPGGPDAAGAP